MENMIEGQCRRLLNHVVSLIILDLIACFIFFIIMRRSENNLENLTSHVLLQFLLSYLLEKVSSKYITLVLSYICMFVCESILQLFLKKPPINPQFASFYAILNFLIFLKFYRKKLRPNFYYLLLNLPFFIKAFSDFRWPNITDLRINREEVALAMERLGQPKTKEGEQMKDCLGYEDFSGLFQESEPSSDELKEAFSVFDRNRDGLVDARDLQRVLNNLGVRHGANLEACERMIEQHDRNKDGNVDLIDFSRLLEMTLLGNGD